MNIKKFKWLIKVVGPLLFIWVLWISKPAHVLEHIRTLNRAYWLLVVATVALLVNIKAWRWRFLLAAQGMGDLSWRRLVLIYSAGLFWGMVTPGRLGELAKMGYLSRCGQPIERTLLNSLLDRIFDLIALVLYGLLGLVFFLRRDLPQTTQLDINWTASWRLAAIGVTAILATALLIKKLKPKWLNDLSRLARTTWAELRAARRLPFVAAGVVTLIAWAIQLELYAAIGRGYGLGVSHFYLLAVICAATFAAMLPISIAGLGVREGTVVLLLGLVNVKRELAFAFAGTFIVVNLLILVIGFVGWILVERVLPPPKPQKGPEP